MASEQGRLRLLDALVDMGIELARERDPSALLDRVLTAARRLTKAEAGTLYEREGNELRFSFVQNDPLVSERGEEELRRLFQGHVLPIDDSSLAGSVARRKQVLNIADAYALGYGLGASEGPGFNRNIDMKTGYVTCSVLAMPVLDPDDDVLGVLELINPRRDDGAIVSFDPDYEQPVRWLTVQAAIALRNRRVIQGLALSDPLTGLPQRPYSIQRLAEEVDRHQRFGHPVAAMFIDLDGFGRLNERLGRDAGDEVLREVAQRLRTRSKLFTIATRWADDTFAVILPNTEKAEAIAYALDVKRTIDGEPFGLDRITASIAIACVPDDAGSADAVVCAAKRLLRETKTRGGNTIAIL